MALVLYNVLLFAGNRYLGITNENMKVHAVRIHNTVKIDGILSENVWRDKFGVSDFIQRDPVEGTQPTQKTVVRVAYDNKALYIGARMYDSHPDSIIARLARRDDHVNSDKFSVFLDPYHDRRSGFYFSINAAGTLYDGTLFNDSDDDGSWNGVWEGKARIDKYGWTAEIRIPFSQLRFKNRKNNLWGIDFKREIARDNEKDYLVYIPKNESGFVSHFAGLVGIANINPPHQFEIVPYVTTKAAYSVVDPNNPFNNGTKYTPNMGGDITYGIGSNLTLNATINPDFGQVEIDPAVINLSDRETFYPEKRPFFIEGASIFQFGRGGQTDYWNFNWYSPRFFYSRRIGRAPEGSTPDSAEYVDRPAGTHIIGAAKLTGKIGNNWNIGTVQALTSGETEKYQTIHERYSIGIEPLTYYGVFRAQKEISRGQQGVGFISTVANRFFRFPILRDQLNNNSFFNGMDGWTFLSNSRTWVVSGWAGYSYLTGDKNRLIAVQENSTHYFQRPDLHSLKVDSSATSLDGYGFRIRLSKQRGNFNFNSAFGMISPGFDINDLGFLPNSNVINMHIGAGYYWDQPGYFYRWASVNAAVFRNYDYDGNLLGEGLFHSGNLEFLNYYRLHWNVFYSFQSLDNRQTRGGPLTVDPSSYHLHLFARSDSRNNWVVSLNGGFSNSTDYTGFNLGTGIELKPASNISFSVNPGFSKSDNNTQWIGAYDDPFAVHTYKKRYVFAEIHHTTLSAGIRLNWTFTPKLSFQLFMQPLISSGNYTNFKELVRPRSYDYQTFGQGNSTFDKTTYTADPDGPGPAPAIDIGNPDFNFISLRGNAVVRWEYMPGSVLYLVWTQTRSNETNTGSFQLDNSVNQLLNIQPDNIFLMKFTYWLNI